MILTMYEYCKFLRSFKCLNMEFHKKGINNSTQQVDLAQGLPEIKGKVARDEICSRQTGPSAALRIKQVFKKQLCFEFLTKVQ